MNMFKVFLGYIAALMFVGCGPADRSLTDPLRDIILLDKDWLFHQGDLNNAHLLSFDDGGWQVVEVPHDWAIAGPFDKNNDIQLTTVIEDGVVTPRAFYGRTGALPHVGVGWYRKQLDLLPEWQDKRIYLEFDGAMSHARVYVNGQFAGEWPYGYASFSFDITEFLDVGGNNVVAVRLENKPMASRWYPGAGIYRHVRMVVTDPVHVAHWGTYVTTPGIATGHGLVNIETTLQIPDGYSYEVSLRSTIYDHKGKQVASASTRQIPKSTSSITEGTVREAGGSKSKISQQLVVDNPVLWGVDTPVLYKVVSQVLSNGKPVDEYETVFGFRHFAFTSDKGFFLNGEPLRLQGVCMHHDLGPLGAAVNKSAIERQLRMLKEMGANAIRTSHNPPAPELLELTDEMGFLVINEAFDEWKHPKVANGYNTLWDAWAEKDLVALIHRDRNHPSVIMWSIGNEIHEQNIAGGEVYAKFLTDICHREDPSRPVTAGFDKWQGAIENGFGDIVDVPGWNYKPQHYSYIHERFPHWAMYGSETASTVSSRGEYYFPALPCKHCLRESYHCSSYDLDFPNWATTPDVEFAAQDANPFMAGEFVWTGFDYLGEPTPYNREWSSRSSYFGIIDLCGIPKDRFYLYQSRWTEKEVLHLLPHWNWEGMEGQPIPVHCYTGYERAELFLNGRSMGIREKDPDNIYAAYRLVWEDVPYEPGALVVQALDRDGAVLKEASMKTAGVATKLELTAESTRIQGSEKEMAFITVSALDADGIPCPKASHLIDFRISGPGFIKAIGNGDPTDMTSFAATTQWLFNGKCVVYLAGSDAPGVITLVAKAEGLPEVSFDIMNE